MAVARKQKQKKGRPRKGMKQKQKKHQQRKQRLEKLAMSQVSNQDFRSDAFSPKMQPPFFLGQGKKPLPMKGNEEAVFAQRYVLTDQDGQQQCLLSNYMSSQATLSTNNVPPGIVLPCRPPGARWAAAMCPPHPTDLAGTLWQDGQQHCVLRSVAPSPTSCGRAGSSLCTLITKDLHYEVKETMPRQWMPYLFAIDPSVNPY